MSNPITNGEIANRQRRNYQHMPPEEAMAEYKKRWRRDLMNVMEASLAFTLGVPREHVEGKIPFTVTSDTGMRKLLWRWHVEPYWWPSDIPWDSPGKLTSKQVCRLIYLFERGKVTFRRLSRAELEEKAAVEGASVRQLSRDHRALREDAQHGAQVRRADALSKKCARRRPKVTKTSRLVPPEDM